MSSEYVEHMEMVAMLKNYIAVKHGQLNDLAVYVDDFSRPEDKPPRIDGVLPDVYARRLLHDVTVIGEAKCASSINSKRTMRQITAFFRYLSAVGGSYFYLAVPWMAKPAASRLMREMQVIHKGVIARMLVHGGEGRVFRSFG